MGCPLASQGEEDGEDDRQGDREGDAYGDLGLSCTLHLPALQVAIEAH